VEVKIMKGNFVLEIAKNINESGQQQIDKFLRLIKEANRLQKELAKLLLAAVEIQEEVYNGRDEEENREDKPIFELKTPDNKTLLVYNPFIIIPKGSILSEALLDFVDNEELKNPEEIKISAYARCPDYDGLSRKISRILCPKYERGLNKNGIDKCDKCSTCIYRSGVFELDGYNGDGYGTNEIQLRQFRIKI